MTHLSPVSCEKCGTSRVPKPEHFGQWGKCPNCGNPLWIAHPESTAIRVIDTRQVISLPGSFAKKLDRELLTQLILLGIVTVVVALFGRDWLNPPPGKEMLTANASTATGHTERGVPATFQSGRPIPIANPGPQGLPLNATSLTQKRLELDDLLPLPQPVVRRRAMPFDSPTASGLRCAAFLPDSQHLMTVHSTSKGPSLRKWVIDTGAAIGPPVVLPEAQNTHMRFSQNGSRLAMTITPSENGLLLLNSRTGVLLRTKSTQNLSSLSAPVWCGDGSLIYGSQLGTIEKWNIVADVSEFSLVQGQPVTSVAVSEAGYICSGDITGEIRIWSLSENGRYAASYRGLKTPIRLLETRVAGNGALVLAIGGEPGQPWIVHAFDLATQESVHSATLGGTVVSAAVSSDWRIIVTGTRDGTVTTWSMLTGDVLETFSDHLGEVSTVAIASDSSCIISGCARSPENRDISARLRPITVVPAENPKPGGNRNLEDAESETETAL